MTPSLRWICTECGRALAAQPPVSCEACGAALVNRSMGAINGLEVALFGRLRLPAGSPLIAWARRAA